MRKSSDGCKCGLAAHLNKRQVRVTSRQSLELRGLDNVRETLSFHCQDDLDLERPFVQLGYSDVVVLYILGFEVQVDKVGDGALKSVQIHCLL